MADLAELNSTAEHGVHGGGAPELHAPRTLAPSHQQQFKATLSQILLLHSTQRENKHILHAEKLIIIMYVPYVPYYRTLVQAGLRKLYHYKT